jgi:hypothetical protein
MGVGICEQQSSTWIVSQKVSSRGKLGNNNHFKRIVEESHNMGVWQVNGTNATIGFNGVVPFVTGGNKTTRIKGLGKLEKFIDVDNVEVYWEIHPSDYEDLYSGSFKEISQSVKEKPDSIHYTIKYWSNPEHGEPIVSFFIIIPKLLFETQFLVWKDFVLGNKQIKYTIKLMVEEFLEVSSISRVEELRKEDPNFINIPTFKEWESNDYFLQKALIGRDDFTLYFEDQVLGENPD